MAPSAENNGALRIRWSKLTETYADLTWSFDKQPPTDAKHAASDTSCKASRSSSPNYPDRKCQVFAIYRGNLKKIDALEQNNSYKKQTFVYWQHSSKTASEMLPWVSEVFVARFPVSVTRAGNLARKTSGTQSSEMNSWTAKLAENTQLKQSRN